MLANVFWFSLVPIYTISLVEFYSLYKIDSFILLLLLSISVTVLKSVLKSLYLFDLHLLVPCCLSSLSIHIIPNQVVLSGSSVSSSEKIYH
jgi:hypothetical protein